MQKENPFIYPCRSKGAMILNGVVLFSGILFTANNAFADLGGIDISDTAPTGKNPSVVEGSGEIAPPLTPVCEPHSCAQIDFDGNCTVDREDVNKIVAGFENTDSTFDINCTDGLVDIDDVLLALSCFDHQVADCATPSPKKTCAEADFDGSCVVELDDLLMVLDAVRGIGDTAGQCDMDGDNDVDSSDVYAVNNCFGTVVPGCEPGGDNDGGPNSGDGSDANDTDDVKEQLAQALAAVAEAEAERDAAEAKADENEEALFLAQAEVSKAKKQVKETETRRIKVKKENAELRKEIAKLKRKYKK